MVFPKNITSQNIGIWGNSSTGAHKVYVVFYGTCVAHILNRVRLLKILRLDE
jgi:hypothetical protein